MDPEPASRNYLWSCPVHGDTISDEEPCCDRADLDDVEEEY